MEGNFFQVPIEIAKNLFMAVPLLNRFRDKFSHKRSEILDDSNRPFQLFKTLIERLNGGVDFRDKTILEIGPGNSLCMGLLFLAMGAKKVYLVDRFERLFWDKKDISFHRKFVSGIKNKDFPCLGVIEKALTIVNDRISLNPSLIEYRIGDSARLPLDSASVDLTFSNAVLEHIHKPEETIKELTRVLRTDGIGYHEVDLRDHFFQSTPLRMLQFSDTVWNLMAYYRPGYTNRLRMSDYVQLFEQSGLRIQKFSPILILESNLYPIHLNKLAKKFRLYSEEDLKVLAFWILGVKK